MHHHHFKAKKWRKKTLKVNEKEMITAYKKLTLD